MKLELQDAYLIFGSLCCIISIAAFFIPSPAYLRWFSAFLFITMGVEWVGWTILQANGDNIWLYNSYSIFEFIFLPLFYRYFIKTRWLKTLLLVFAILFPFWGLANMFWIQKNFVFDTYTYLAGSIFMIAVMIHYIYQIVQDETRLTLYREPLLFISLAYLIFFIVEIPFTFMLPKFITNELSWEETGVVLYRIIKILNILLYILFSTEYLVYLWRKKQA